MATKPNRMEVGNTEREREKQREIERVIYTYRYTHIHIDTDRQTTEIIGRIRGYQHILIDAINLHWINSATHAIYLSVTEREGVFITRSINVIHLHCFCDDNNQSFTTNMQPTFQHYQHNKTEQTAIHSVETTELISPFFNP